MPQSERAVRAARRELTHQRWADNGGFSPEPDAVQAPPATRPPWLAVGAAAALRFAVGWLTARRPSGGRRDG